MTLHDRPAFQQALERMARLANMRCDVQMLEDWWTQLQAFPIDAVTGAMERAHRESGRYKPTVGLIEQLCGTAIGNITESRSSRTRYVERQNADGQTIVEAEYHCHLCCDIGWRGKVKATGVLLTEPELQTACASGTLSVAAYAMTRCACRTRGQMRGAA
jgi:hypothetical protein